MLLQEKPTTSSRARNGLRAVAACLIALLALFLLDAALFRSHAYFRVMEPDSSTGAFEYVLRRELKAQRDNGNNLIATFGDSRLAYLPRLANELTPQSGLVFRQAGVAASDARVWFYMLRDLDPQANRYRALVFGVEDYMDEDKINQTDSENINVLHFAIFRFRLTDLWELPMSYDLWTSRFRAFRTALFKGFLFQTDFEQFLAHPQKRLESVRANLEHYDTWTYDFQEDPRSLAGLEIDWKNWTVKFPPHADAVQISSVNENLMRAPAAQNGRRYRFRRYWFNRILDRYRNSPTRIIFIRLPRGPIPRPDGIVPLDHSAIRELAGRPNVVITDEHSFDSLEHPELFKDGYHVNREGAARFSKLMVEVVGKALEANR